MSITEALTAANIVGAEQAVLANLLADGGVLSGAILAEATEEGLMVLGVSDATRSKITRWQTAMALKATSTPTARASPPRRTEVVPPPGLSSPTLSPAEISLGAPTALLAALQAAHIDSGAEEMVILLERCNIRSGNDLAVASEATLADAGVKKGPRIKLQRWQKLIASAKSSDLIGTASVVPPPVQPSSPQRSTPAESLVSMGLMSALQAANLGDAAADVWVLLDAGGMSTGADLLAASDSSLSGFGVKKGPRMKILKWQAICNVPVASGAVTAGSGKGPAPTFSTGGVPLPSQTQNIQRSVGTPGGATLPPEAAWLASSPGVPPGLATQVPASASWLTPAPRVPSAANVPAPVRAEDESIPPLSPFFGNSDALGPLDEPLEEEGAFTGHGDGSGDDGDDDITFGFNPSSAASLDDINGTNASSESKFLPPGFEDIISFGDELPPMGGQAGDSSTSPAGAGLRAALEAASIKDQVDELELLLKAAGLSSVSDLAAASDWELSAAGIKKGPRIKISRWKAAGGLLPPPGIFSAGAANEAAVGKAAVDKTAATKVVAAEKASGEKASADKAAASKAAAEKAAMDKAAARKAAAAAKAAAAKAAADKAKAAADKAALKKAAAAKAAADRAAAALALEAAEAKKRRADLADVEAQRQESERREAARAEFSRRAGLGAATSGSLSSSNATTDLHRIEFVLDNARVEGAAEVASILIRGGIHSSTDLLATSDAALATMGVKKGPRMKISRWQSAQQGTPNARAPVPIGPVATGPATAVVPGGSVPNLAELGLMSVLQTAGLGDVAADVWVLLDGGGMSTGADLLAASDATLSMLGLKKGPRMKISRWQAAQGLSGNMNAKSDPSLSASMLSHEAKSAPNTTDILTALDAASIKDGVADVAELLKAGGILTGEDLLAAPDSALSMLGIKKGPRMKITRWKAAQ